MAKIEKAWFMQQLKRIDKTASNLATYLDLDASAVSRMLSGERRMMPDEIAKTATFFDMPIITVMEKAGIPTDRLNPKDTGLVSVRGTIDAQGNVTTKAPKIAPIAVAPPELADTAIALRYEIEGGANDFAHGWIVYYAPVTGVALESVGSLCVSQIEDSGELKVAVVKRSLEKGKYKLISQFNDDLGDHTLVDASPICWIKTLI